MDCLLVQEQMRFTSEFLLTLVTCEIFATFVDYFLVLQQIYFLSKFLLARATSVIFPTL
ncbi:unnamed protein product, partial [Trichogramma brassicae]